MKGVVLPMAIGTPVPSEKMKKRAGVVACTAERGGACFFVSRINTSDPGPPSYILRKI
jgi:hypothetical protein